MFGYWDLIQADLHEVYGLDVGDRGLLATRTWPWLLSRITGLLTRPNNIAPDGTQVPSTRLGWQLFPPKPKQEPTR